MSETTISSGSSSPPSEPEIGGLRPSVRLSAGPGTFSTLKPADLEGELTEILKKRSHGRTPSQVEAAKRSGSRSDSLKEFNIFKKSITYDSQYKEYEEAVVFKEPNFKVKRVVSPQGELMLTALAGISRKVEVMAMLPEIMSRLVFGELELEQMLGDAAVEAILRLFFLQVHWIEYRNVGEPQFRALGASLDDIKKRLQKGARYPPPNRKRQSFKLLLRESLAAGLHSQEEEEGEYGEEEVGANQRAPAPTPSSLLSSSVLTSPSTSVINLDLARSAELWIGPGNLGIPTEKYMREVVNEGYREVFRLITSNETLMTYLGDKIQPEVTQAVKVFYGQVQLLEGLMYVKFLMTPEEEIRRQQHLKNIWIQEQRLLREYRDLEESFSELGNSRERAMRELNAAINSLISQIDSMSDIARYEINKLSGEANKQDLVNTKKYDQDLQQLDGNFQSALKFAMHLRAHYSEIENGWRKQRFKLEADLEALIANYDKEMGARQQSIDDCLMTEEANTKEIEHLEKVNEKVMKRYAQFKDETTIKKIRRRRTRSRMKEKKGKRGRGGKKKKGGSGSKKGGSGSKKGKGSKSPSGKTGKKAKGSKGRKGKKAKKAPRPTESESESDYEMDGEERESQVAQPKQKASSKRKGKEKKEKKGKKVATPEGSVPTSAPPSGNSDKEEEELEVTDGDEEEWEMEEWEEEEEEEGMFPAEAPPPMKPAVAGATATKATDPPAGSTEKKSKKKGKKKGKRSKSKRKKKSRPPPPEAAEP